MSNGGTIEVNHSNFLIKIDVVRDAIDILKSFDFATRINTVTRDKFIYVQKIFADIKDSYAMEVVGVLTDYYDDTDRKVNTADTYGIHITSDNYSGKLTQCMDFVESVHGWLKENAAGDDDAAAVSGIDALIADFKQSKISTDVKEIDYDVCVCGDKMKVFPNTSELVCQACGETLMMYGTVFEDTQFYNQEGQRSKHGCYDPSRHCKFWVSRIQAKENADIPKECIDQIMLRIKRDGIKDCRRLLCAQIRVYLKETRNTEYNDHIPLIRKIITGIVPPQLTREELRQLYNLFDKAVNTYEDIKPPEKSNTMYYPYIIYKILDQIIEPNMRKKRILECIHLQSRDTLISNDNLWERICTILVELTYKPTDRNDQKIDL